MSELSKRGILEILRKFETEDLCSLANTVTQGFLKNKISRREEAINAIVKYSQNELSILKRKIVTRDVLFQYLHENQIAVSLPFTKQDLIEKILKYWRLPKQSEIALEPPKFDSSRTEDYTVTSHEVIHCTPSTSNSEVYTDRVCNNESYSSREISRTETDESIYLMAQQFAQWFYSMMNQNTPLGTEHFYQDANLKLNLYANGVSNSEFIEKNPEDICSLLFRTKTEHNLFFNPNISKEGVQGRRDPHGLVIILACGTLHVNSVCAGVFEQVFALARDPFADNNWKIKNTELNLRSASNVSRAPSLGDSELTSNLLSLPSS